MLHNLYQALLQLQTVYTAWTTDLLPWRIDGCTASCWLYNNLPDLQRVVLLLLLVLVAVPKLAPRLLAFLKPALAGPKLARPSESVWLQVSSAKYLAVLALLRQMLPVSCCWSALFPARPQLQSNLQLT